ncbi:MAG: leucyl aminopeptidase [Candidatus Aenigmarchaeota archaeon]|nr:leucyl aminopeptidase [Candidatus Aenigmarchaeota archaeon]
MQITINQKKVTIECSKSSAEEVSADASIFFLEEDSKRINSLAKNIGADLKKEEFNGSFDKSIILPSAGKLRSRYVMMIGLGKKDKITTETMRRAAAIAAKRTVEAKYPKVAINLHGLPEKYTQPVAEGFFLSLYSFDKYKKKREFLLDKITICGEGLQKSIESSIILSESVSFARDLVNTPASDRTPKIFADVARKECKKYNLRFRAIGKNEAGKTGLNAFLAVARGSSHDPFFLILEWNPRAKRKIALVGKGITFDSGGLDIKPADSMLGMHGDVEGAAVVLGTMTAAARSKLPLHIIGIMPLCENMPSGSSYKPGDIIRAYNGKTIEVINTDAEGRVVLADALAYAEKKYKPEAIIDIATLTGACVIALGHEAAGLMGNNEKLMEKISAASSSTDERVWQLPLWDDYRELVKSDVAEVRNTGKERGAAGPITGAAFLEAFVNKTPWAHLDIAGVTLYERNKYYMPRGSTGWGIRLLHRLLSDWK